MAGGIRRRGKRSWEISYYADDPATGSRTRRYETVRGTRKDAEIALTESRHKRDKGIDLVPDKTTVGLFLRRWLKDYASQNVAESTYVRYEQIVETHLIPTLGTLRLKELRPAHIQAVHTACLEMGLSRTTVHQHHRVISQSLKHAVAWQLIAINPAAGVLAPRPVRREFKVLEPSEAERLLDQAEPGSQLRVLLHFAIMTGLRQGEIRALRWTDVDLDDRSIHVTRSARDYPGRGVIFSGTKTHRSRRSLSLAAVTVKLLRGQRVAQTELRLREGPRWEGLDLVFSRSDGTPLRARDLDRDFKRVVSSAALGPLRFHDLRHTAATLMLKNGTNAKVVSERLGHATVAFTLDRYAHVLPTMQRDAAEALAASLGG